MCALFNRKYQLIISMVNQRRLSSNELGGWETTGVTNRINIDTSTYIIQDAHIEFDIKFDSKTSTDDMSKITIYNTREDLISSLMNAAPDATSVDFKAGYAGDAELETIFSGVVSATTEAFDGVDRKTTLHLTTVSKTVKTAKIKKTFGTLGTRVPVNPQNIMDWYIEEFLKVSDAVALDAVKIDITNYAIPAENIAKRGPIYSYSIDGELWTSFKTFCEEYSMGLSIVNNEIVVSSKDKYVKNVDIPHIFSDGGMIDSPTIDTDGGQSKAVSLKDAKAFVVKTLLRGDIKKGFKVAVSSSRLGWDKKIFNITEVSHKGGYEMNEWYTSFRINSEEGN